MLSCAIHDYIEIACLYHYRIQITLIDSETIQGEAMTTRISTNKKEYLLIQHASAQQEIELDNIKSMQALTHNPHFDKIDF